MTGHADTIVEFEGCRGLYAHLAGPEAGDEGYVLAPGGFEALFDPEVKVVYEEPGNWPGGRFLSARILTRNPVIGLYILDDPELGSWMRLDSELRKNLSYVRPAYIHVQHPESDRRTLEVRLGDGGYKVDMKYDPNLGCDLNLATVSLKSGDPFWWGEEVVISKPTLTDTTFDPTVPPNPLPSETINFVLGPDTVSDDGVPAMGANPCDEIIYPKWELPGSTLPPSAPYYPGIPWLGAPTSPYTRWTVPDFAFEEDPEADEYEDNDRRVVLPDLIGGLRTNEQQMFTIVGDARPTGGNFKLGVDGEITSDIVYNASEAQVKAALEALPNVQSGDILCTRGVTQSEIQQYVLTGNPTGGSYRLMVDGSSTGDIPIKSNNLYIQLMIALTGKVQWWDMDVAQTVQNTKIVITPMNAPQGGTFKLSLDGVNSVDIAWNASALDMMGVLGNMANIGFLGALVTKDSTPFAPWIIEFTGLQLSGLNVNNFVVDSTNLTGPVAGPYMSSEVTQQGGAVNTIYFKGAQAGVNFPPITVTNAAALTGGTAGAKGGLTTTIQQGRKPYIIEYQGSLQGMDLPLITADWSGLTGGSGVSIETQQIQEGFTAEAENAIIDTDPRVEQVTSESDSELWGRMNGVRFLYPIPDYTEGPITFPVSVSGAVAGQLATLRLPRPWTRPWGLE